MKILEALHTAATELSAHGVASARFDAELLLSHVLHKDRAWVFTHAHDGLDAGDERLFRDAVGRRSRREPLQYILGTQEFWGLEFRVTPDVLIPRPETELVVESALGCLSEAAGPTIIDLCTGSGCIAVSLAKECPGARIFATDRSGPALAVARKNAQNHDVGRQIRFLEGDLFQPLDELDVHRHVDVITANPPYIESRELGSLQPEVRDFEPEMALISGPEGTEFHERILARAPSFLRTGGALIMELGIGQSEKLKAMAAASGFFSRPHMRKDLAGIDRVVILQRI